MTSYNDRIIRDGETQPSEESASTARAARIAARDYAWFGLHPRVEEAMRALYGDEEVGLGLRVDVPEDALYFVLMRKVSVPMWGTYTPEVVLRSQHYLTAGDLAAALGTHDARAFDVLRARAGGVISQRLQGWD